MVQAWIKVTEFDLKHPVTGAGQSLCASMDSKRSSSLRWRPEWSHRPSISTLKGLVNGMSSACGTAKWVLASKRRGQ